MVIFINSYAYYSPADASEECKRMSERFKIVQEGVGKEIAREGVGKEGLENSSLELCVCWLFFGSTFASLAEPM
jgi:hypothetical protein